MTMRRAAPLSLLCAASLSVAAFVGACGGPPAGPVAPRAPDLPSVEPNELRPPEAFFVITDKEERARALFTEALRVMTHPRCINCHPNGDSPLQRDRGELHDPPVHRGPEDKGIVAMECRSCHQDTNLELARVPGAVKWQLAPLVMAWVGKTPHDLCEQVKDRARNGGKSLDQIVEHAAHDPLVAWGWSPGSGRTTPPGTQAGYGALMRAWVEAGAACPISTTTTNATTTTQEKKP